MSRYFLKLTMLIKAINWFATFWLRLRTAITLYLFVTAAGPISCTTGGECMEPSGRRIFEREVTSYFGRK